MSRRKPSHLSLTSLFCGAGGDTQGAAAAGLQPDLAVNHWQLAVQSHSENFPTCAHDCRDISQTHPSRYGSTHLLWASPECITWSQARGKRRNFNGQMALSDQFEPLPTEAEERSRVQMWDVVTYAEHHQYEAVIVENVIDIMPWNLLPIWLQAMDALGYRAQTVMLNSMFTGVPQSRDRVYFVFTRKGNRKPELEVRPASWCPRCEKAVEGVQSWKKAAGPYIGRYRAQYVFCCPKCAERVLPFVNPAASAIDWALPMERIGDRKRPLAKSTMARIAAGIQKYWIDPVVFDMLRDPKHRDALSEPLVTQTGRQSLALYLPLLMHYRGGAGHWESSVRTALEAMGTVTADGNHHALIEPLYVKNYGGPKAAGPMAHPVSHPLGTITDVDHHGLLTPLMLQAAGNTYDGASGAGNAYLRIRPSGEHPLWSLPGTMQTGLVAPLNGGRHGDGGHKVRSTNEPLLTQTGDLARALITSYYGREHTSRPVEEPLGTQTAEPKHALVTAPQAFLSSYYSESVQNRAVNEPMDTQTGRARHGLVQGPAIDVEDCGYRMLEPHEIAAGMAFQDGYVILGNKREQVQQCGQAVTPPAAEFLWSRVLESLR